MNPKYPIFNDKYFILKELGEGISSKVYLARSIEDSEKFVVVKFYKQEFLQKSHSSI